MLRVSALRKGIATRALSKLPSGHGASKPAEAPQKTSSDESGPEEVYGGPVPSNKYLRLLHPVSYTPEPPFDRRYALPGSFAVQLSIGSVYAWSLFNSPLSRELGVVAEAAGDWGVSGVLPIFGTCALSLGVCTMTLGAWAERVGPRKVSLAAAACWGSGLLVSSVGVFTHTLPLLYLGYGVLGGFGWGLGYISPVSSLMKWFPDRRGLATGLALTAFGGGAILASPLNEALLRFYFRPPLYLGHPDDPTLVLTTGEDGRRFAYFKDGGTDASGAVHATCAEPVECVVAGSSDLSSLGAEGLLEGVYVVGTGSTGAAATFLTLSVLYTAAMTAGAFAMRLPHRDWRPPQASGGHVSPLAAGAIKDGGSVGHGGQNGPRMGENGRESAERRADARVAEPVGNVPKPVPDHVLAATDPETRAIIETKVRSNLDVGLDHKAVLRTPQFYLFWLGVMGNATAGVTIMSCSKTLMHEVFHPSLPLLITATTTSLYVSFLSLANMSGRLGWAAGSDFLGRKRTAILFSVGGIPCALAVPYITRWATDTANSGNSGVISGNHGGDVAGVVGSVSSASPSVAADGVTTATATAATDGLPSIAASTTATSSAATATTTTTAATESLIGTLSESSSSLVLLPASSTTVLPLSAFILSTTLLVSFYGGVFSVLPAHLADTFGQRSVGAIHGRVLTAWATAACAGPIGLSYLRERSYRMAVDALLAVVDKGKFEKAFGVRVEDCEPLVRARTVTIARLMEIAPEGTVDPTPMIYDSSMYAMAGMLGVALVCNSMIRAVPIERQVDHLRGG